LAKVFERILSDQMTNYFISRKLFGEAQHGFRANHSCETALQVVLDDWKCLLANNKIILSLFIDFKKAFDLVNPKLLFLKLFHYGFDNKALDLIRSYFDSRRQKTKINNSYSEYDAIELGVPQGSIFGPLLFIIFINDLTLSTDFLSILFADDTSQYDSDDDFIDLVRKFLIKFQHSLNWINHNHLYMNWSKTKFMCLSNTTQLLPAHIMIDGNEVELVTEFKLLGVTIDNKLAFDTHVKQTIKQVNCKLFALKNLFFLCPNVRAQFFKTFILPHFDYCFSLFIYMNQILIEKLVKSFNTCIYRLFSLNLNHIELPEQLSLLKQYSIMPLKYRYYYRFCIFAYKILNKQILNSFYNSLKLNFNRYGLRDSTKSTYIVPFCKSIKGNKRLSIVLPKLANLVLKNSFNHKFNDFRLSLFANLEICYKIFDTKVMN
jgi:hypothetical protein